jgi:hypothetical protein
MLTVVNAIIKAILPEKRNINQLTSILYAKFCSHIFIAYQAIGQAIKFAMRTHLVKSLVSATRTSVTEAPSTFLIPISLVRLSLEKETRPNKPRQEINIAMIAIKVESLPVVCSVL